MSNQDRSSVAMNSALAQYPAEPKVVPLAKPAEQLKVPRAPWLVPVKPSDRYPLLGGKDIMNLPALDWVVEGLIPVDAVSVLGGPSNTGKSFLGLEWGISVALGQPTLGRKVKQGDVVYLFSEGTTGLNQRFRAHVEHNGVTPLYFKALPTSLDIANPAIISEFADAIRAAQLLPRLIIVDTLSTNFGGQDENDTAAMAAFVSGCDRLRRAFPGSAVLVIHHTGKNPKYGLRGAYALTANVHTVMMLKADKSDRYLVLSNVKQKDGARVEDIWLRRRVVKLGDGQTSCVIELDATPSVGHLLAAQGSAALENEEQALKALRSLGANGAKPSAWRRALNWGRTKLDDTRRALVEKHRIEKRSGRYVVVSEEPKGESNPAPDRDATYHTPTQLAA